MKRIKHILSYVWPFTRRIKTDYNGYLELVWMNGEKVLNSENANYSYGTLQIILEEGISKIKLDKLSSILILGLGGGSVVHSLNNKFHFKGQIDAIEIDKEVIAVAKKSFGILDFDNLKILHRDAIEYVSECTLKYDLIIVDLFIDQNVPSQFLQHTFCEKLANLVNIHGSILFNLGINLKNDAKAYQVVKYFNDNAVFTSKLYENVNETNTLLIAEKQQKAS